MYFRGFLAGVEGNLRLATDISCKEQPLHGVFEPVPCR